MPTQISNLKHVNISIKEIGRQFFFHAYESDDCISSAILKHGCWENFQTFLELRILSNGDQFAGNFIDVGANIGWHSTVAALAIDSNGRVWSFEPHPTNFKVLSRNITTNAAKNVELIEAACSDFVGNAALHMYAEENMGAHSLHDGTGRKNTVDVRVVTLDSVFEDIDLSGTTILKIDVEGLEHKVISGSDVLLKKIRENCAIIIEINIDSKNHTSDEVINIIEKFRSLELLPFAISPSRIQIFPIGYDYLFNKIKGNMDRHGFFFADMIFLSPTLKEKVAEYMSNLVDSINFGET